MTDHAEEQEMEAEALLAIFDTHFHQTSAEIWSVDIYPEAGGDPSELDRLNHVACKLLVTLPETYPETQPELDIEIIKGLAEEHQIVLKDLADEEAEANLGVPCIFTVAERLREWLVENNQKGLDDQSMHAQMIRKQQQQKKLEAQKAQSAFESQKATEDMTEAEKEELAVTKRRAEGTPCNKENFEAWKERFEREMAERRLLEEAESEDASGVKSKKKDKAKEVDKSGRLTGFQHFSGKQDNLEALEAAAENAVADEDEEFEGVDEDLFDEDVDLDDLDFDDEEEEDEDLDI